MMQDRVRLQALDTLRGLAAFCVLFYHWEHMLYTDRAEEVIFGKMLLPSHGHSFAFFLHGDRAVDLFFVLSGFIFYWLYSNKIASRQITAPKFFGLRFSRLYPLHLLTLVIMAGFYAVCVNKHPLFFKSIFNLSLFNASQALQNIAGVSSWLPSTRVLNAPFWSVSIELLLYCLFFALCRHVSSSWWTALLLIAFGLTLRHVHLDLMRGLVGFFLGGAAHHVHGWITARGRPRSALLGMGALTLVGWVALLAVPSVLKKEPQSDLVFAVTIIFLALLERRFPSLCTRFSWMGDASYSVYMIHYPLLIAMVMVNAALGGDMASFHHAWSFPLFLALVLPLGLLSYHAFEMPAQRFLRKRLDDVKPGPVPGEEAVLV